MNILDTFDMFTKPNFYHIVNHDIHELTGITTEEIQTGKPFEEPINLFKEWCGGNFKFITCRGTALSVLRSNLKIYSKDTERIPDAYDAQPLFDDQFTQEDRAFALNYAPAISRRGLQDEYFLC